MTDVNQTNVAPPGSASAGEVPGVAATAGTGSQPPPAAPASGVTTVEDELQKLKSDLAAALKKKDEAIAESRAQRTLAAFTDAGSLHPAESIEVLVSRGQVSFAEDGSPLVRVGEEWLAISKESIAAVLPKAWLRTEGVGGTGSRGSRTPYEEPGLDEMLGSQTAFERSRQRVRDLMLRSKGGK